MTSDLICPLSQREIFTAPILDDCAGFVVIAQVDGHFLKINRVPTVIRKVITVREMQYPAFRELVAGAIPELLDDANGVAGREIPDIHHAVIFNVDDADCTIESTNESERVDSASGDGVPLDPPLSVRPAS